MGRWQGKRVRDLNNNEHGNGEHRGEPFWRRRWVHKLICVRQHKIQTNKQPIVKTSKHTWQTLLEPSISGAGRAQWCNPDPTSKQCPHAHLLKTGHFEIRSHEETNDTRTHTHTDQPQWNITLRWTNRGHTEPLTWYTMNESSERVRADKTSTLMTPERGWWICKAQNHT